MAKILQLLRNNAVLANFEAAKTKLTSMASGRKDGEAVLARYTENGDVKTALGIYHVDFNGKTGVTILQDSAAVQNLIDTLQAELDNTQVGAGLATDGSYVKDTTDGSIIGDATSILDADKKLAAAIKKEIEDREAAIEALDDLDAEVEGSVVVAVVQEDGQVKASDKKQAQALVLTGFTSTGETGSLQIAASDTIGGALNKIENYFKGLDLNEVSADGQPIVKISQANGQVSAEVGDIAAAHVTVADADDVITATNVEGALTEIAKKVNANKVSNSDKSIVVTEPTGTATTTDIKVNIKSGENVIKLDENGIYTSLDLTKVETGLEANVKEAYRLLDSNGDQIGTDINIYKDSALLSIKLLHADGNTKPTYTDGEWTDIADQSEAKLALCYAYQDVEGNTVIEAVPVGNFLRESEFKDGLQVATNGEVSVKKDTTSGKVITAYSAEGNTETDVLTISAAGVKIANIQEAIDAKVGTLDKDDEAVAGEYVSKVVEENGIITVSRAEIGNATIKSYSKGTDATAVADTDTVNSAISKLENQVDKAKAASKTEIDTTVTGESASHMTITKDSTAADGHDKYSFKLEDVASEDALEVEIERAETAEKVLATSIGAAYNDETKVITAYASTAANKVANKNEVKADIAALDAELDEAINEITSANKAIAVGDKTNKAVELTLTLDATSADTVQTTTGTANALAITDNGLFLSTTWDCGTYGD